MTTDERTAMGTHVVEFERTVRFRTTIEAPSADAAYDAALAAGDALDGDVVALHAVDEFSVTVPEQSAASA